MRRTRTAPIAAIIIVWLTSLTALPAAEMPSAPPEWLLEHFAALTTGSGVWLTDNAPYKSEDEPFDAYGTEWKYGLGKMSLIGRLFGMKDGKEIGTFWQFRVFWHPGEHHAVMEQIGSDGTLGVGTLWLEEGKVYRAEQTFFSPGSPPRELAHDETFEADIHKTVSYNKVAGQWKTDRIYVWKLVPKDQQTGK